MIHNTSIHSVFINNPAPSGQFVYTLPTTFRVYFLIQAAFTFTADANVANRTLRLLIQSLDIYTNVLTTVSSPNSAIVVTANNSSYVQFLSGNVVNGGATIITGQLPAIVLKPNDVVSSAVQNIQITDQVSLIQLLFLV